ncbi:kinase-like protein [Microthyrium microscopicum]|uniref:Kinase-like protein n=1 Tax=Microthyrium microscopicum TaxID=703497 RepID=A0A6A6UHZ1_9PEZI|nr:kinase-like protein [Microthyrium microscopicum]
MSQQYQADAGARDEAVEIEELKDQIIQEIKAKVKCADEDSDPKAYILPVDVKAAWSQWRIARVLWLDPREDGHYLDIIYERMTTFLTILIRIDADRCLQRSKPRFVDLFFEGTTPRIQDGMLPLEPGAINFLSTVRKKEAFVDMQYRFCPWKIQIVSDHDYIVQIDSKYRLPFEKQPQAMPIGEGAFGEVSIVPISPGYLIKSNNQPKSDTIVAVKKIAIQQSFEKEARNLKILTKSLARHENILQHYAVITHGTNSYVVMPYARLGDLWQFMHNGKSPYNEPMYNFTDNFPRIIPGDVAVPLIRQLRNLSNALQWLHHSLVVPEEGNFSCCHMDLKPDNILIDEHSSSPVGVWKISDFGLSVMNETSRVGTVRDYISQASVNTRPGRIEGTYTAPEVEIGHNRKEKIAGSRGDVWSFACIIAEVLAFALGQEEEVEEFFEQRRSDSPQKDNDYFYTKKSNKELKPNQTRSVEDYQIRSAVTTWLDAVPVKYPTPQNWAGCWAETVKTVLDVDSATRPSALELVRLPRAKSHMLTT